MTVLKRGSGRHTKTEDIVSWFWREEQNSHPSKRHKAKWRRLLTWIIGKQKHATMAPHPAEGPGH